MDLCVNPQTEKYLVELDKRLKVQKDQRKN